MEMIIGKAYPAAETYYGDAYVSHNVFRSIKTGFEDKTKIAQDMVNAAQAKITESDGTVLEAYVWIEQKSIYGVPIYEWTIDMYYYMPRVLFLVTAPMVGYAILIAVSGILVIWTIGESSRKIFYGYAPVIDPNTGQIVKDPNVSLAEVMNKAITYIGPLALGYGMLKLYQTYQETR